MYPRVYYLTTHVEVLTRNENPVLIVLQPYKYICAAWVQYIWALLNNLVYACYEMYSFFSI